VLYHDGCPIKFSHR